MKYKKQMANSLGEDCRTELLHCEATAQSSAFTRIRKKQQIHQTLSARNSSILTLALITMLMSMSKFIYLRWHLVTLLSSL